MIPVYQPSLDGKEKEYLTACIESGWISSEGSFVKQFEERFSARVWRKHGITVSSGSTALDVAVTALGVGPGDEVIMPTFTIISCAAPVVRAGGIPVLVDSDRVTWNMDARQIEQRITPRTKAIMIVHIYGLPVDMDPVLALAEKYGLKIIEDAAEMHGQSYKGRPCGSFGDLSIFSFYTNKHVTMGEGGIIVTDNEVLAERCRSLRNLCFQKGHRFMHEELGWNFRLGNLQAAVGCAQLERLDETVERKRQIGRRYTELLTDVPGLQLPFQKTEYAENVYWMYGIVLKESVPFDGDEAALRLSTLGVGTRPFFWCMHEQGVFRRMGLFRDESYPEGERLARRGFYIPSSPGLTDAQMEFVVSAIRESLR